MLPLASGSANPECAEAAPAASAAAPEQTPRLLLLPMVAPQVPHFPWEGDARPPVRSSESNTCSSGTDLPVPHKHFLSP